MQYRGGFGRPPPSCDYRAGDGLTSAAFWLG